MNRGKLYSWAIIFAVLSSLAPESSATESHINKDKILQSLDWLQNQDFDWYKDNIPFLETPDKEIDATYYYRWELVTRHICYGSPASGYSLTEFANRPFWSGAYGAIACPSGHQFNEIRWMHNPRVARDYLRYWFRTKGAQPRKYSSWLADSAWAVHQVHPNKAFIIAPVYKKGATIRDVYLPAGKWYDWWTGKLETGSRTVQRAVDLATMPIYVRGGAIVPVDPIRQYTGQKVDEPMTLKIYRGANGKYTLYDDDGISLDYLQGDSVQTLIKWDDAAKTLSLGPASKQTVTRTFQVELIPDGVTRLIQYSGRPLELKF